MKESTRRQEAKQPRGRLFVISAPSGAGKTSLVRDLIARSAQVRISISYTTRPRRESEIDGIDYFFVDDGTFQRLLEEGEFLEHAEVFGHQYGTSLRRVDSVLSQGDHVVLEIDWQGAQQVRASMPEAVSVFILPPSMEELERRLRDRGTDSKAVIRRRLEQARGDIEHWREFDFVVINDEFDRALYELEAIVADPARPPESEAMAKFVRQLLV